MTTEQEFDALYGSTHAALLGYFLRRVEEPADAADLLSEVFLVAWRRRSDLPDDAHLWLFGVARKVLAAHRRRGHAQRDLANRLRNAVVEQYAPEEGDLYVRQVLDRLPTRDRDVMELAVYERLTPTEIASVLGDRPGTIRVRMHRARQRLQKELGEDPEGHLAFAAHN